MKKTTLFILCAFIINMATYSQDEKKTYLTNPEDIFSNPQKISAFFKKVDFIQAKAWSESKAMPGEYFSFSEYKEIGSNGPSGIKNNLCYYFFGTSGKYIDEVRFVVNINNSKEHEKAMKLFISSLKEFFEDFNIEYLPKIEELIKTKSKNKINTDYGIIEIIYEKSKINTFKFVLKRKGVNYEFL